MDADPEERNIMGVVRKYPQMARDGIRLRQFGQQRIGDAGRQARASRMDRARRCQPSARSRTARRDSGRDSRGAAHYARGPAWFKGQIEKFRVEVRIVRQLPLHVPGHGQ